MNRQEEEMSYEFNAQFDYVREAYGATALDPLHEGYCDYLMYCENEGIKPTPYAQYVMGLYERRTASSPLVPIGTADDEIPF